MWGTLPLPWRNSSQYETLKRAVEVLADSDKPWRMDAVRDSVPENAGVSKWEMRKLDRFITKKTNQKKEEIYCYELAKFALGETNDLKAAKRNAESLGYYAYERAEEEKAKPQAQKAYVKPPQIPSSILQQYQDHLQKEYKEQMKKIKAMCELQNSAQTYVAIPKGFGIGLDDDRK